MRVTAPWGSEGRLDISVQGGRAKKYSTLILTFKHSHARPPSRSGRGVVATFRVPVRTLRVSPVDELPNMNEVEAGSKVPSSVSDPNCPCIPHRVH
jgi:hypothetical protein